MVEYFRPAGPKTPEIFGPAEQNSARTEYFVTDYKNFANANLDSTFHFSFPSNGQTDRQQLRFSNIDFSLMTVLNLVLISMQEAILNGFTSKWDSLRSHFVCVSRSGKITFACVSRSGKMKILQHLHRVLGSPKKLHIHMEIIVVMVMRK